jgi:pyrimidine deaminase RibD-like protein
VANKHLDTAKDLAKLSKARYKHGALVVRNGQVVSAGVNISKGTAEYHWPLASEHAEERAISQAGKDARGATLYVARVNRQGVARLSKPCKRCASLIVKSGIIRVVHT